MIKKIIFLMPLFAWLLFYAGCAANSLPHENFKYLLQSSVGKAVADNWITGNRQPESINRLENGRDEYRYLLYKQPPFCVIVFEVDPPTHKIIASNFEGNEKSCWVVP